MKINLKQVNPENIDEAQFLYCLLAARPKNANISHRNMPSFFEHLVFMNNNPYRFWWIIMEGKQMVGATYLTFNNEVGVSVVAQHQHQGIAREALKMVLGKCNPLPAVPSVRSGNFVAHINPKNKSSISLFKKMGFEHVQSTFRRAS